MADVEVRLNQREIDALARDPEIGRALGVMAAPMVREARTHAPKLTGAMADSIRADNEVEAGGEQSVHISFDRDHFYGIFHERGTRYLPARPFLVPTTEGMR